MKANRFEELAEAFGAAQTSDNEPGLPSIIISQPDEDPFDYDSLELSEKQVDALRVCRSRIAQAVAAGVIEAGRQLRRAKDIIMTNCPRGTWSRWLKGSLSFSESTARNYMRAAEWSEKCSTFEHLPPGVLYEVARASKTVRQKLEGKLKDEDTPTAADINRLLIACREEKAATKNADDMYADTTKAQNLHSSQKAARQAISTLRTRFDDPDILELVNLIFQTTPADLMEAIQNAA